MGTALGIGVLWSCYSIYTHHIASASRAASAPRPTDQQPNSMECAACVFDEDCDGPRPGSLKLGPLEEGGPGGPLPDMQAGNPAAQQQQQLSDRDVVLAADADVTLEVLRSAHQEQLQKVGGKLEHPVHTAPGSCD